MWYCRDCGSHFEEDEIREYHTTEYYEIWGSPHSEEVTYFYCPYCDSTQIYEE